MRRVLIVFVLLVPLLASCGDDGDTSGNGWEPCEETSTEIGHPTGSTDVVLRTGYGGGLPPPLYYPDDLPGLVLYGDGLVLVQDNTASYATPRMLEGHLDEAQVQEMLHAVEGTCSLERDWTLDAPVYDVGGFWVETTTDAGTHHTWATGLNVDEIAESIPEDQSEQRSALSELDTELRAIAEEADLVPYEPDGYGVFFEPVEAGAAEGIPTTPWPLEEDLATFGQTHPEVTTVRCGTLGSEDASVVVTALTADANGVVPALEDADTLYRVIVRPMLPGETDCLALIA